MIGECSICCEKFGNDSSLVSLATCKHKFHFLCVFRWLKKHEDESRTCPQCFGSMNVSDLRTIHFDFHRILDADAMTKRIFKQMAVVNCGIEFQNKSFIIANLEHERDILLEIIQELTTNIMISTIVISNWTRRIVKSKCKIKQSNEEKAASNRNRD